MSTMRTKSPFVRMSEAGHSDVSKMKDQRANIPMMKFSEASAYSIAVSSFGL